MVPEIRPPAEAASPDTADEAAAYTLSFNFNLTGVTTTGGSSHERSVGFGVVVIFSNVLVA